MSNFHRAGYLGLKVSWKNGTYYIVNIYSSCSLSLKRVLWRELLALKDMFTNGEWLRGGDFNDVTKRNERIRSSTDYNATESREFSSFIDNSDLIDVACKGRSILRIVETRGPKLGYIGFLFLILSFLYGVWLVNLSGYGISPAIIRFG